MYRELSQSSSSRAQQRNKFGFRGFTLLEVLVVITILGILATVLAVNYRGTLAGAKHKIAIQEMARLKDVLEQYNFETGAYPAQSDGLTALTRALPGHSEPLVTGRVVDPWGRNYVYACPGTHGKYDLVSLGADGVEGGDGENADVVSWLSDPAPAEAPR